MESQASRQDGAARAPYPSPREVACWLLPASRPDEVAEGYVLAAERAYAQLRSRLVTSLGELGFDALWMRAIQVALRPLPPSELSPAPRQLVEEPPVLRALVSGADADQTRDLLLTIFASFLNLLITFIGEALTFHILYQLWPALVDYAAGSSDRRS